MGIGPRGDEKAQVRTSSLFTRDGYMSNSSHLCSWDLLFQSSSIVRCTHIFLVNRFGAVVFSIISSVKLSFATCTPAGWNTWLSTDISHCPGLMVQDLVQYIPVHPTLINSRNRCVWALTQNPFQEDGDSNDRGCKISEQWRDQHFTCLSIKS